jgi:hydroxyacylglutathione hydrolase
MLEIIPLPAFNDNYIWMIVNAPYAVVVDPGDASVVSDFLQQRQLQLKAILITHHHHDHTGGAAALAQQTQATIFGPANSSFNGIDQPLQDGEQHELPNIQMHFTVFTTPGHTLDHICYYSAPHLFCGDTLFAAGCGRLFEGTATQMHHSLSKIAALPTATKIYCAHEYTLSNLQFAAACEPHNSAITKRQQHCQAQRAQGQPTLPSVLTDELTTNPFLRSNQATIQQAAEQFSGQTLNTNAEVFAAIRAWKDQF